MLCTHSLPSRKGCAGAVAKWSGSGLQIRYTSVRIRSAPQAAPEGAAPARIGVRAAPARAVRALGHWFLGGAGLPATILKWIGERALGHPTDHPGGVGIRHDRGAMIPARQCGSFAYATHAFKMAVRRSSTSNGFPRDRKS